MSYTISKETETNNRAQKNLKVLVPQYLALMPNDSRSRANTVREVKMAEVYVHTQPEVGFYELPAF